jgi:hypothetical protein
MSIETYTPDTYVPLTQGIETVIQLGMKMPPPYDHISWHTEALERAAHINTTDLSDAAVLLLHEINYTEIADALEVRSASESPDIVQAKLGRRLMLTARDAIIMSSSERPSDDYDLLFSACSHIGKIADVKGSDPKMVVSTIGELRKLQDMSFFPPENINNDDELMIKIQKNLHTDGLAYGPPKTTGASDSYHEWRKDFRRVANAFILMTGYTDSSLMAQFAAQGAAINKEYGNIKDALDNTA